MSKQIFVNVAVTDLDRSKAFFAALGFHCNPEYTNDDGACVVIDEHIYVMLLREAFFRTFTDKQLCDTRTHVETLTAITVEGREQVDDLATRAVAAGGREPRAATDYGFMYSRMFEDPDGHTWELVAMTAEATKP